MNDQTSKALVGVAASVVVVAALAAAVTVRRMAPSDRGVARSAQRDDAPGPAERLGVAAPGTLAGVATTTASATTNTSTPQPLPPPTPAERAAAIQNAKRAIALLPVSYVTFGTAYCVDPSGVFVADLQDVVGPNPTGGEHTEVQLVLEAGEPTQRTVKARQIYSFGRAWGDVVPGISILQVEGERNLAALELGSIDGLPKGSPVTAIGFPRQVSTAEGAVPGDLPTIEASIGRFVGVVSDQPGRPQRIELQGWPAAPAERVPLLDERGRLLGITMPLPPQQPPTTTAGVPAQANATEDSGPRVAVGIGWIAGALRLPILLSEPVIPYPLRHQPREFRVRFIRAGPVWVDPRPPTLEVRVYNFRGTQSPEFRTVQGEPDPDTPGCYRFRFEPVPTTTPAPEPTSLNYETRLIRDGKVVLIGGGGLAIADFAAGGRRPPIPAGNAGGPPPLPPPVLLAPALGHEMERQVVQTNAPITDLVAAGNGRYLALALRKADQLALLELATGTINHTIELPQGEILLAAGATKLLLLDVGKRIALRYDLKTLRREAVVPLPIPAEGLLLAAAMGSGSEGPLALHWAEAATDRAPARVGLFDPVTLRRLRDVTPDSDPYNFYWSSRRVHLRMAADGTLLTVWSTGSNAAPPESVPLHVGKIDHWMRGSSPSSVGGFVIPGPDGREAFSAQNGVLNDVLEESAKPVVSDSPNYLPAPCFPANVPGFYLTLPPPTNLPPAMTPAVAAGGRPPGYIWMRGRKEPLLAVADFREMMVDSRQSEGAWKQMDDFTFDKRVHFLPDLGLLVTIPWSDNLLCLRQLDLAAELDRIGIDYLFVTSRPSTVARPGEIYRYSIDAKSRARGVRFVLDSGPRGMTVSPGGELKWQVPPGTKAADVILRVTDASGQNVFQTFTVTVSR